MMFLVGTQDLLVIFISLGTPEPLALHAYCLQQAAACNPGKPPSKYFLFGGMSAAFLLFGFSLLYGLSNSTSLRALPLPSTAPP